MLPHIQSNTPKDEKDFFETPPQELEQLSLLYGPFLVDLFANEKNHKFPLWFGPNSPLGIMDTFNQEWVHENLPMGFHAFGNPPYSRGKVAQAIEVAYKYALLGIAQTTLLSPVSSDQRWFHRYVWNNYSNSPYPNVEIFFFARRIPFIRPNGQRANNPTSPSMAVTFFPALER